MEPNKISNAYTLYINLYCKRKGGNTKVTDNYKRCRYYIRPMFSRGRLLTSDFVNFQGNRQKARRSWVSLSPAKRKHLYKTACHTNMIKCAETLVTAQPYLKEKFPRTNDNTIVELNNIDEQTPSTEIDHNVSVISTSESQIGPEVQTPNADDFMECDDVSSVLTDRNQADAELEEPLEPKPQNCETNVQHEIARTISESTSSGSQTQTSLKDICDAESESESHQEANAPLIEPTPPHAITQTRLKDICDAESESESHQEANAPLIEPTPPRATLSQELYYLLKGPGATDWRNIDLKEKCYYIKATRAIKLNYVKEYTKYLESLSHQQLCELYIKTFH